MSNLKILCLPPIANTLRDLDMRFTWVWLFRASQPCDDIICVAHFLFDWECFAILQTFVLYEDYEDQST